MGDRKTLRTMSFFKASNLGRTSKVCRKVEDLGSGFSGGFRNFDFLRSQSDDSRLDFGSSDTTIGKSWCFILSLWKLAKQASSEELGRAVGNLETDFLFASRNVDSLTWCCEGFLFSDKGWNRQVSRIDHSWWPWSFTPSPNFVEFHILVDFLRDLLGCNHASCVCLLSVVKLWPHSPCCRKPVTRVCEHWQRHGGAGWQFQIAWRNKITCVNYKRNFPGFGAERSCDLGQENYHTSR